ncbi:MAG: histidine--tRNA ligase [Legionellales bacterium]|nr:histidine--tRNA ligase [Legionellales bacterium]
MSKNFQAVRGMNDILPEQMSYWEFIEEKLIQLTKQYHYQQIRFPILEKTALFSRSIGDVTDIVEKEMYIFEDRNGDSLALRPEGTAGCVRACIQHGLINRNTQKLWYIGPMFRHERPQKGRYRQFYQFGLEAYGFSGAEIDAEMILFGERLWKVLGLSQSIQLQINTLGSNQARIAYKKVLVEYYQAHYACLDEDSQRRLQSNPLRILDSKNPEMIVLNKNAPKLIDYLDAESRQHFEKLTGLLDACGIEYVINPCLVRGLDYYCKTVFEWVTDTLGAQGTVCAGGHYDALVEQLGGASVPAIGFAMGFERIIAMLIDAKIEIPSATLDVFFVCLNEKYYAKALALCEIIRADNLNCYLYPSSGSLKSQMKKADKSKAQLALILGEEEYNNDKLTVKYLRHNDMQQLNIAQNEIMTFLQEYKRSYHV